MGRHEKIVLDDDGLDKRAIGYYSTPAFIAQFITAKMLEINPQGKLVLDPCIGREEMVAPFFRAGKRIVGLDIIDYGPKTMSRFQQGDFLDYYRHHGRNLPFDYYIANPPYNCHENRYIRQNKGPLRRLFPEIGALNMYSLFIAALIDCAKPGALIGLLTNDSFLTARLHKPLREKLIKECRIHYLLLCPTDLFAQQGADVRTCIMILEKRPARGPEGPIKTKNRPATVKELMTLLEGGNFDQVELGDILLDHPKDHLELVIGCPPSIKGLFHHPRLNDHYPCITGISTGDDRRFLSQDKTDYYSVPFYKNPGRRRFRTEPDGYLPQDFLEISRQRPNFIVRNRAYLFQEGIICSSMGVTFAAAYLPPGATFGVNAGIFPREGHLWWLLAYLNTSLVTYLVRGVLLRTNMITSGYVGRIPLLPLGEGTKDSLARLAHRAYEGCPQDGILETIDRLIFQEGGLGSEEIHHIQSFCHDLIRRT
ncbi:MAG: N-6 DNA methylase [Limnochordia bacterium]